MKRMNATDRMVVEINEFRYSDLCSLMPLANTINIRVGTTITVATNTVLELISVRFFNECFLGLAWIGRLWVTGFVQGHFIAHIEQTVNVNNIRRHREKCKYASRCGAGSKDSHCWRCCANRYTWCRHITYAGYSFAKSLSEAILCEKVSRIKLQPIQLLLFGETTRL